MPARKLARVGKTEEEDVRKAKYIRSWKVFIETYIPTCKAAEQMEHAIDPMASLRHTLYERSANTLSTRLSGIQNVIKWQLEHFDQDNTQVSFSEPSLYRFAGAWHKHPSTVASAIGAVKFAGGVFEDKCLLDAALSGRVAGAAAEELERLPPRKQAEHLEPEEISAFETFVCNVDEDKADRILAWSHLVLTCLRARYSDLRKIANWEVADGLLTIEPVVTKTSGRDKSRLPLVMLGPVMLFSKLPWFSVGLELRRQSGIELGAWPFYPAYDGINYSAANGRVGDYNLHLKDLARRLGVKAWAKLSSHTAKASLLTFASREQMTVHARSLLGYHAVPGESRAVRSYDRNRLLGPVEILSGLIDGFSERKGLSLKQADEDVDVSEQEDVELSSESGSSSEAESEFILTAKSADSRRFINTWKSRVHCGRFGCPNKTSCGKTIRSHYKVVNSTEISPEAEYCHNCFYKRGGDNDTDGSVSSD